MRVAELQRCVRAHNDRSRAREGAGGNDDPLAFDDVDAAVDLGTAVCRRDCEGRGAACGEVDDDGCDVVGWVSSPGLGWRRNAGSRIPQAAWWRQVRNGGGSVTWIHD
jgi:hypothetical protein